MSESLLASSKERQEREKYCGLSLKQWNDIQKELISRSGLSAEAWIERYSPSFRDLLEGDANLVDVILKEGTRAAEEVEERLSGSM